LRTAGEGGSSAGAAAGIGSLIAASLAVERDEDEDMDSDSADSDQLGQEEGVDAEASEPQSRLVSKAFADRRHAARRWADAKAPVVIAYVCEMYQLRRYADMPPELRGEQLLAIVQHYLLELTARVDASPAFVRKWPRPPFVRHGEPRAWPAAKEGSAAEAEPATPVASRRHADVTPANLMHPPELEPLERTRPEPLAQRALYEEACEHVVCILERLDRDEALSRMRVDYKYTVRVWTKAQAAARDELDVARPSVWARRFNELVRSPHLTAQLEAMTNELERQAKALNGRMPGEPFGDDHDLNAMGVFIRRECPEVAALIRMSWCRPPSSRDGPFCSINMVLSQGAVPGILVSWARIYSVWTRPTASMTGSGPCDSPGLPCTLEVVELLDV